MSTDGSTGKDETLRRLVAEAWNLPRRRLDTATVLEVYVTEFSIGAFAGVIGLLCVVIGMIAMVAGKATNSQGMGPGFIGFGAVMLIVAAIFGIRILSGKRQYRDHLDFGGRAIEHILAQPSAPNMHMYERVALGAALGDPDEDPSASLRAWMTDYQEALTRAILAGSGVAPDAKLYSETEQQATDLIPSRIYSELGELSDDGEEQVPVDGEGVTVWRLSQPATFRFRAAEATLGALSDAGEKVAETVVHSTLSTTVTVSKAGDWWLVEVEASEPVPGPAEGTVASAPADQADDDSPGDAGEEGR